MITKAVIGTWPLSGDFGHVGLNQISETLDTCWELGFREFDTAPNYGNGFIEFCLGKTFHGKKDYFINTKCGNIPFNGKSFELESLTRSLEQSLKRTGAACINVLFLHNPRTEIVNFEPYLHWFENLKKSGKVLRSGISLAKGYTYSDELLSNFDVVQDDINLLYLDALRRKYSDHTVLMARSPLASGLLSGHFSQQKTFDSTDQRQSWMKGERLASILARIEKIKSDCDLPLDQLARRFLLSQKTIGKVIFGVKRKQHVIDLKEDLEKSSLDPVTVEHLKSLYESDFGLVGQKHLSY